MNSLDYLLSFQKFGIKLGLDNIRYLLRRLGDPHENFRAIHIGGTNGKGSIAAFIHSVLVKMGYAVGTYTSPHLLDFSERMVVNDDPISQSETDELVGLLQPIVADMERNSGLGHPTFFEAVTAMAFEHFRCKKVDFAVVEVGMGGRFDSTNVINPCVSIIGNVDLEHRSYLGDTFEEIALEKAGIIKSGIDVVSGAEQPEVRKVINGRAGECHAKVYYMPEDFRFAVRRGGFPQQWIDFFAPEITVKDIEINLPGGFQARNAALAMMSLEVMKRKGFIIADEAALRRGMADARWPARLEKLTERPLTILDVAHNPAAMRSLVDAVDELFPEYEKILVVGMLSDKDVTACLRALRRLADRIIVTQPAYERALSARRLSKAAQDIFKDVKCEETISSALNRAMSAATPKDMILVTGSLFNVAEVRAFISNLSLQTAES